ncbi:MAG: ribosomal protein S18-alanine N-acetyltransferase [Lachnospiraceae bacterium]|nr:ribosomal protein S18-alanine N-acetyltransferase [Lachnospiraceae bacterium]
MQDESQRCKLEPDKPESSGPESRRFNLRMMTRDDVPKLARMDRKIFNDFWSEAAYLDLFRYSHYINVTAEAYGEVVGCACMALLGTEGGIDKVMVDELFRGQGIGMALVQELLRLGSERGVEEFTLEVRKGNLPAIKLYEKAGFVSEGIRPGFYDKPREDALIMWNRAGVRGQQLPVT